MDHNSEIINDFESLLMARSKKKTPVLYTSNEHQNETLNTSKNRKTYSAIEVLRNVSKQIKSIQNADTATCKRVNKLDKYKKREFVTIEMLPVHEEVPKPLPAKFETQCVTDTQLFNVIENAEIIDKHRGVTQEFDKTFCQKNDENDCDKLNDSSTKADKMADGSEVDKKRNMKECNDLSDQGSKLFENSDIMTCEMDAVTCHQDTVSNLNGEANRNSSHERQEFSKCSTDLDESKVNEERSTSPVLNAMRRNNTPPLVVSLYTFEEFENLAHPIIEEQEDLEMAKNLINSQILGREVSIPDHVHESSHRESPVLNKIECITTNINKEDFDNKNKYIDKNITCNQNVDSSSENREMESKVIKAEIKDEILFSSDEEYEYLHKDVQELPLTCALETSFYDKSDVLDKTMYVGFQTASNKSIQIHTDSFMKAKSILSSIDSEKTETSLKDLVKIFDTGKSINENVQNMEFASSIQQFDSGNNHVCEVELESNDDLAQMSLNCNEDEEKIGDTLKNVSLTALEQEENINDNILVSQVITYKSTPRSVNVNNCIISENIQKTDTNKHLDDDIIMSQVIEFKSVPRSQKIVNKSAHNVFKTPLELYTKRKLEGFKTASNKKIKLSDKALARCRRVFQDIDINENGDSSDHTNLIFNDAKSTKIDSVARKIKSSNGDNISKLLGCDSIKAMTAVTELKNSQSKIEQINNDNQTKYKDTDFQINDEEILQEFEDNEMPFEKMHNNAYVGFKADSDKNITISDTAFTNTGDLFQDIMNMNTQNNDVSESGEKCIEIFKKPVTDFKKVILKQTDIENGKFEKPGIKTDEFNIDALCKPPKTKFIGFKTASNKEIKISDQALEKTKHFYKDLDQNATNDYNEEKLASNTEKETFNDVEDKFNCGIDTQDFLTEELAHIEDLFKDNITANEKPINPTFQGFRTASRQPVIISKNALEKSKKFFEDITNKESDLMELTNIQKGTNIHRGKTSENDFLNEQEINDAVVQTAVKNRVSNIIEDNLRVIHKSDMCSENPTFTGFKTANSKPIKISAAAVEKSKRLLNEFELKGDDITVNNTFRQMTVDPEPSTSTFIGFQTASNKKINISAKALAKSKQMMNDFELKDSFDVAENTTKSKKETDNSGIKADNNIKPSISKFVAFQTASNKQSKISNEALARSKQFLQEKENYALDEEWFEPRENASPVFNDFQIVNVSENSLEKSKRLLQDIETGDENQDGASTFEGFQTASNEEVKISEKSRAKIKKLFEGTDISLDKDPLINHPNEPPVFTGFQTASNKVVEISEKALAKSKKLFEDFNVSQVEKDHITGNQEYPPVFKGLQTASNKKVEISEKALAKSKQLIEDMSSRQLGKNPTMNQPNEQPVFRGFQTASNKKVEISEKALVRSKKLFEDFNLSQVDKDHRLNNEESAPVFKGFQTASKKKVKISDTALAKGKELFHDLNFSQIEKDYKRDSHQSPLVFKGFQTASNKKVEISEKALAKSKQLFEDINLSQNNKDLKPKNPENAPVFKGFQTASKKKVEISEKMLVKSKKLFDDFNLSQIDKGPETNNLEGATVFKEFQTTSNNKVNIPLNIALAKPKKFIEEKCELERVGKATPNIYELPVAWHVHNNVINKRQDNFEGFQTGGNKKVKVPEQALVKSKDIFKDIHEKANIITAEVDIKSRTNIVSRISNNNLHKADYVVTVGPSTEVTNAFIKDDIDTQVLNDFQDTQNTEDFCKNTPKSKRSGSPILSCPRAKKRKFETPYRSKKKIEQKKAFVPPKVSKTFNFNQDYKKKKKYNLKDVENLEKEYPKIEIDPYIAEFKFDTLLNFKFINPRNDYTEGNMAIEELKRIFLDSVNKKIVPDGWLDNHIKLILWKLLSYEVKYPNVMKNTCTVRNVLEQLKYRYDRELYQVQRPILRKVLEKDEVASKTMILCVVEIYVDNISVTSVSPNTQNMELLLTDGWYCVKATTDRTLIRMAVNGSIVVGTKIAVCGAELINCEQGVAPWEDTSSVRLKLSGNSVRRARWFASLGIRTDIVRCPLRAVRPDGGKIASLRVVVTRVYPPLYVEKMEDGSTVTLSERLENIRQSKYESERQSIMEKLYEEVEKEMSDQDSQDSEGCSNERTVLESGSQISKYMKKSKDPDEYRSHLTKSQNKMLEEHNAKQREKLIERVRVKFQQKLDKTGLKTERNVAPLLKVRVAGLVEKDGVQVSNGYMSIWRPSSAVLELLTEGAWIEILNIIPTGIRNSEIQLSAGRQTVFNPYKQTSDKIKLYSNTLKRKCYEIGELTQNPSMTTDYNEIDTVGMIFSIEPSTKELNGNQNFQNVYLADADKNILCVNFWGGLKKFGFENVLDTGQIVNCVNLQKRAGNTRKSIPEYRVTEFSYFTKTPKDKKALEIATTLSNKLSKIKDIFCADCVALKSNYSVFKARNNENVSPYNNCNFKMVSPLRNEVNMNLTGLDFDSSFDTQDISPQMLLRKRKINEKIEKIRMYYGEPPPLSSIHIINKSKNASATYKSPLVLNSERPNAVSGQNAGIVESPVSMDRTYVKNINPVKLNFSNASLNDNVDHFAEQFDASPPLSLDSDTLN